MSIKNLHPVSANLRAYSYAPADLPVAVILRGHYVQLQVILSNSEVNKGKMDHKKSRKIYFVLRYSGASKSPRVVSQCHVGEARICEVRRFRDCDFRT